MLRSSADSASVPNATVELVGKGIHFISDNSGRLAGDPAWRDSVFKIHISHIGFEEMDVSVKWNSVLYLKPSAMLFEAVVYTGEINEKKRTTEAIANVKVIPLKDIKRSGAQNLGDVLQYQSNIKLTNDPVLGTSVSINGMDGQNVKLLKNGAGISGSMNGSVDVSQISTGNISQIEIIEGPMSLLYGSNALAGTINLISKMPGNKTTAEVNLFTQSTGIYNAGAGITHRIGKAAVGVHLGRNFFDGWNSHHRFLYQPAHTNPDSSRSLQWKPREQLLSDITLMVAPGKKHELKLTSDMLKETIVNRGIPTQPYFESAFDDYYYTFRNINSLEYNFKNTLVKHNVLGVFTVFRRVKNTFMNDLTTEGRGIYAGPDNQDTTRIYSSQLRYISSFSLGKIKFNTGIDFNHESFMGKRVSGGEKSIYNVSLVAIAGYSVGKADFKLGLRQTLHSMNKIPLIPSAMMKYKLNKHSDIRFTAGSGYRTPGVKELYLYFVDINHNIKGNPNLKSEASVNYNLTFSQQYLLRKKNRIQWQAGAYYNAFKNLITLAALTQTEYTYVNIGTYSTKGVNADASYITSLFETRLQGSWLSVSNSGQTGPAFFNTFNTGLKSTVKLMKDKRLALNAFVNYFGKTPFIGSDGSNITVMHTGDYVMADFTMTYLMQFRQHKINLSAGLKNIGNITNIRSGTAGSGGVHDSNSGSRVIGTGRNLFLGLEFNL